MWLMQKLITSLAPRRWAQAMETESRSWMIQCPCGAERSEWDAGGIRYKAFGEPRWWRRCAGCGKRTWHRVYYRTSPVPAPVASPMAIQAVQQDKP
jgi:hypothetical protein